jgi:HD-GYP domain-containing protein (c-di-GMP phosphodiesterase class II)
MPDVLIWGRVEDVLGGPPPDDVTVTACDTLAALQAATAGDAPALILVDPDRIGPAREAVASWLAEGGTAGAQVLGAAPAGTTEMLAEELPFLDGVLAQPVSAARLRSRLARAAQQRAPVRGLQEALARQGRDLHELNKIGVALSAQRDIRKLLELILTRARELTTADAGSLYQVERGQDHDGTGDDLLRFKWTQNDSVKVPFEEFTMPLTQTSLAGYASLTGNVVNLADAYALPAGAPYSYSRSFDERSGYRTKSILTVPMRDHKGEVIGVVQLINKKRDARARLTPATVDADVVPFSAVDEEMVSSLASQAAVAYENTRLIQDIRNLFDSFVSASVSAIESRDPTTSGHSARVALLTVGLAERMDALESGPFREVRFSRDQLQEIRYASLLHDFGKVGVREKVLIKGKKLYVGEMLVIRQRFAYIQRTLEAEHYRAQLDAMREGRATPDLLARLERDHAQRLAEIDEMVEMIATANEPSILEEESFRALMDLTSRSYADAEGGRQPYLTPNEAQALAIRRGSLSEKERREIESHVTHTYSFLSKIPWTGEFRRVPEIAYAHHEKLDGTGYPRKLSADQIPVQSRMMTIADIFDALVAWDRPYKKSVPAARALDILREEAGAGKLDGRILDLFVEARVYERGLAARDARGGA